MPTHIELEVVNYKNGKTTPQLFNKAFISGEIAENPSGDGTLKIMYEGQEVTVKCTYEVLKYMLTE